VLAIARHLKRDRKTIRAYLSGQRQPGRRKPAGPDRFAPFERYCRLMMASGITAKDLPRAQGPATSCPSTAAPMTTATYLKDLGVSPTAVVPGGGS